MRGFVYETASGVLSDVYPNDQHAHSIEKRGSNIELDTSGTMSLDEVDRTRFFATPEELSEAIARTGIQLVGPDDAADARSKLPISTRDAKIGTVIHDKDIGNIIKNDRTKGTQILSVVDTARQRRAVDASYQSWWMRYADNQIYSENVFAANPTEQFVIGPELKWPITIYNFSEALKRSHIQDMVGALAVMSELTEGYTRRVTPYVIIHEAFLDEKFTRSGLQAKAAARAWLGDPYIELRRSALDGQVGSAGQSWLQQMIGHEISHQIDYEVDPTQPDFGKYFHYVDADGDGLIDYTTSRHTLPECDQAAVTLQSLPHRDYGLTNGHEDLSVAGEEVPFGGNVDDYRRNAYLAIIRDFVMKERLKYGNAEKLPDTFRVEHRTGGDIRLPVVPALMHPIRLRVSSNSLCGHLKSIFKQPV